MLQQNQRAEELLAPFGGVVSGEAVEEIGPLSIAALVGEVLAWFRDALGVELEALLKRAQPASSVPLYEYA